MDGTDAFRPPDDLTERRRYCQALWDERDVLVTTRDGVMARALAAAELGRQADCVQWLAGFIRRHPDRHEFVLQQLAWARARDLGGEAMARFDPNDPDTWLVS